MKVNAGDEIKGSTVVYEDLAFGARHEQLVRFRRKHHTLRSRHSRYGVDNPLGAEVKSLFRIVAQRRNEQLFLGTKPK